MELKEKLLNRLGIAEAMAHRAKQTTGRLQKAAAKHHDAANADIAALGQQIEAAGVGADEDAEDRYCRALVARGHMIQAHHLAGKDAARMPEVGQALEKGRINRRQAEAAGQAAMGFEENQHPRAAHGTTGQYKPGEFVPKGEQQEEVAAKVEEDGHPGLAEAHREPAPKEDWQTNGVRSKAFKSWFGDWEHEPQQASKVLDKEGEPAETFSVKATKVTDARGRPRVVYHGHAQFPFSAFSKGKQDPDALFGPGFYFTEDKDVAQSYRDKKDIGITRLSRPLTNEDLPKLVHFLENKQDKGWSSFRSSYLWRLEGAQRDRSAAQLTEFLEGDRGEKLEQLLGSVGVKLEAPSGQLHAVYLNIREPFNIDRSADDQTRNRIASALKSFGIEPGSRLLPREKGDGEDLFHAVCDLCLDAQTNRNPAAADWKTSKQGAVAVLKKAGFDGITHTGGRRMGGGHLHHVWIAFEPEQIKGVDNEGTFDPTNADLNKAVRRTYHSAAQPAMAFEEQQHPREAKGDTMAGYKPGEFVPKGEQSPPGPKEAWETPLSDMKPVSHYNKQEWDQYADEKGRIVDSSRTTPQQLADLPLGTWRYSDWKGPRGREVEQLREVDPKDLIPGEDTDPTKHADVARYAEWAKEGKVPPPLEVVETIDGKFKVVNGHRRWLAAKRIGTPRLRAWVSPSSVIPDMLDSEGRPMKTGLTHELAIHHAIEAGHRVPDEVLQDYPELKERHDRKRKEALRDAAQSAEEDGHPGLAEVHEDPNINKAVRRPFVPPDMPAWPGDPKDPYPYLPLNFVEDRDKCRAMAEQMAAGHWTWNVPLIRCGAQLLTGSHRFIAAKATRTPLKVINVDDLFKEAGLDFRETWEQHAQPYDGWLSNLDYALKQLPPELLAKYGVDLG